MSCASKSAAIAGVPVVRPGGRGGARYELDEEALRRVLLRPGVQELPAVVVSVAGAYRGGKSFILDFFLRYLTAAPPSQLSGEWLGIEDEPLKGFHWRGGAERDTTGIHLWLEPIVTTTSNGEKVGNPYTSCNLKTHFFWLTHTNVAVLLMDTQGTFYSDSTIAQNSAIFALSTFISSVQIYNLSGNIKEDDLQPLQLFTAYGKLACEGDDKAFQTLLFLVRDWASPYEHAHGYCGGATLLSKRLQSKPNQNPELREVREHIRSCFDSIKCFLMPHPGHAVEKQNFTGCLRELTEKFRLKLLELVPSLFDTPKLINGERVRVQDLFDYFRKYVDIYNGDEAPEVTTIYKATADISLLAASRAASSVYAAYMEPRINGPRSLSRRVLADAHAAARASAEKVYAQKKKLGSQTDVHDRLQELIKELQASLSHYELSNDANVRKTVSLARKAYDTAVSNVCGDHAQLCLHPDDLKELHDKAYEEALKVFDSAREVYEDEEDEQRTALVKSLEQQYGHLRAINEQNNKSAVLGARDQYVTRMKLQMDHTGVSSHKLEAQNQVAKEDAIDFFAKKRNRTSTNHSKDPYFENLMKEISSNFVEYEKANINNNRCNTQVAESAYINYINSEWESQTCCLHPRTLDSLHKRAVDAALEAFMTNQERGEEDDIKMELIKATGDCYIILVYQKINLTTPLTSQKLEQRGLDLVSVNKFNNEKSVKKAFNLYCFEMDQYTRPAARCKLLEPFMLKHLPRYHEKTRMLAISDFRSRRRGTDDYGDDAYLDDLKQRMAVAYAKYRNPAYYCFFRHLRANIG
ncbi:hypothetical protein PYW07_007457 [Mythimna separata]|uniref:GB1/RHD3-type G domain-containing protein n=1 Tax=Mythimna separata TaxID=271217 RepID=A0AAD8E010_MYTSE|nr:hypothetical protein PYW07_007457 [Mythimna separata]